MKDIMTREEAINEIKSWDFLNEKESEAVQTLIPELSESEDERIRKYLIEELKAAKSVGELKFIIPQPTREECIAYLEKQKEQKPKMTPKWLYRLEFKDSSCGLWYDGTGKWCFESGIGSIAGCKTKTLPMDYDVRYKQDGRDWFSSCSQKEDLMHWYSLEDAKELISKGFVFTRYLATEYHEYEQQTVFIKETALYREEIDIFELFGQKPAEWSEEDGAKLGALINYFEGDTLDYSTDDIVNWLKSLRPSWKPSEEQMHYLCEVVDEAIRKHNLSIGGYPRAKILESLYKQLQKL